MIEFFRDKLDGPLYIVVAFISLFLIMAIIGFIMERKKLEREQQEKIAYIDIKNEEPQPIEKVAVEDNNIGIKEEIPPVINEVNVPLVNNVVTEPNNVISEVNMEIPIENEVGTVTENNDVYVKPQVIVFEDPDEKKE